MKDRIKLLVVADPFPGTGGNYRAKKSLLEYPRRGIEPYLVVPSLEYSALDKRTLLELAANGVRLAEFKGFTRKNFVFRRLREILYPVTPKLFLKVDPKKFEILNVDTIMSFHETWLSLWLCHHLASELDRPSLAVLQLPVLYSKQRLRAIYAALRMYFDYAYSGKPAKRSLALLYQGYRRFLDAFIYAPRYGQLLRRFDMVLGISRAICAEMGLEESSREHCMDPGVSHDEGDLELIEGIKARFKEKRNHVVFGGRPTYDKGVVEGLIAFREISRRLRDYKLYIAGRLEKRELLRLHRIVKMLGIEDKVVFTGFVSREERLRIVGEARLMLYPSHVDAYPYAVAESLLLGTPIAAYDIPAIDIYFRGLEGVRVVQELDVEAMADEAVDILTSRHVDVEPPRLRPWSEIIEEEVSLIKRVAGG